jgi:hypothetical protein
MVSIISSVGTSNRIDPSKKFLIIQTPFQLNWV